MAGPEIMLAVLGEMTPAQCAGEFGELRTLPPVAPPAFDPRVFDGLINRVFHIIEREIWNRYRPGNAPPARRFRVDHNLARDELEFGFEMYDGQRIVFRVEARSDWSLRILTALGLERICIRFFDCAAENFNAGSFRGDRFDWRSDNELRRMVADAGRGLRPRPTLAEGYASLGVDLAGHLDHTTVQIHETYVIHPRQLVEARNMTATEVMQATDAYIAQQVAEHRRRLEGYGGVDFLFSTRGDAEARGLTLLKEWLSPAQRDQYERTQTFDVIGQSGRRYRIKHGSVQNVYELDREGREICGWCFAPAGNLVAGDVMLAQKVALETNERGALAVANEFRGSDQRYDLRHGWVDETSYFDLRPGAINRVTSWGEVRAVEARIRAQIAEASQVEALAIARIEPAAPVVVDSRSWTGLT